MSNVTDEILQEMVEVIVEAIDPEQIILFGSRATGKAGPDSDMDLLIVDSKQFNENRSRRKELGNLWRSLARFRIPLDLLLYTVDEFEKWHHSNYHIIGSAVSEGKVIYERG